MKFSKRLSSLPIVIGVNHPLSLGWKVRLCASGPLVKRSFRAPVKTSKLFQVEFPGCKGLHIGWPHVRECVIYIDTTHEGSNVAKSRLVELIVHEVSHCVDEFFLRACITNVDTEIRAYMNDWIVGETVRHFKGFR